MMLKDGIHPNAKGAAKMADIIFDAIEKNKKVYELLTLIP